MSCDHPVEYCGPECFVEFKKIPRLNRDCVITEKIDGTNGQIQIDDDFVTVHVGSRSRWLDSRKNDNHGFFGWVEDHREDVLKLGPGRHYGEWWGSGINRGYGLQKGEKRFSLFNTGKWSAGRAFDERNVPDCIDVVPVLYQGPFDTRIIADCLYNLKERGSYAAPGYMNPEGLVIYHTHANQYFKVTVLNDEVPKSQVKS